MWLCTSVNEKCGERLNETDIVCNNDDLNSVFAEHIELLLCACVSVADLCALFGGLRKHEKTQHSLY